jgi:tetratricopeptide (TPR) repeat protein
VTPYSFERDPTRGDALADPLPARGKSLISRPSLLCFRSPLFRACLLSGLLAGLAPQLFAQQQQDAAPATAARPSSPVPPATSTQAQAHGQLLLVLPFENAGGQPNLDWIGAAVPEIFNRRFASAGFLPISRGDRAYALDHLGLPQDFKPTHASTLRLAQTLDADYVVLGSFRVDGTNITATARVLDVNGLRLSQPIVEQADLNKLADVLNTLAWRVTRQLDPAYPVAEQTFIAADANLRLDVFENYVRGLVDPQSDERIRHLREAVRLSPQYYPAWLALGQALFAAQQYDQSAIAFGHLTRTDPNALEADFYRGLAYFYTGKYLQAEDAFAFVSTRLPLPEVVNNQGVAASRRGKPGMPLFQQAITADPKDADYHFNYAVALARHADASGALRELDQVLKLRPSDTEAQSFANNLRNPAFVASLVRAAAAPPPLATPAPAATTGASNTSGSPLSTPETDAPPAGAPVPAPGTPAVNLPLERIKRSYNEAGFRQAAFEMEQMEALRSAALPSTARAQLLVRNGDQYLGTGLLVEAEREYKQALAADPSSAAAHAGLAQVRERTGDRDAARSEAQRSLELAPNVTAHLVLARLDLLTSQLPAAAKEVTEALRISPSDANARGLKLAVESRGQQVPD